MKINLLIIAVVIGLLVVVGISYFAFYKPYEDQVAYQRNVECNGLVTKYENYVEATVAQFMGNTNGWIFGEPQSHFNTRLNTCLGEFHSNNSWTSKGVTYLDFTDTIEDVVGNNEIIESEYEMVLASTTLQKGLSPAAFKQQAAILMSE